MSPLTANSQPAVHCASCGSSAVGAYLATAAGEVLRCRDCKTVFLSPHRPEKPAEALYSQEYFTEREGYFFHDGVVDGTGAESAHVQDFRAGLDLIEQHRRPPGTLLDVGCATGSFLRLAKERGWACRGVEVSSFAADQARRHSGCEVFCGPFEAAPFADASFDVVTMWDLLEHLPVPREALVRVRALLKPAGLLLVNTPNENSLLRKVARLLYRGSAGRLTGPVNRLYHDFHLYYFGADPLRMLFQRAGFDLILMKTKEIPMSRGRISPATKAAIRALSAASKMLGAEYEIIVLAARPG